MDDFNPYRPPRSGLDPADLQRKAWRSGRLLVMEEEALLPDRCYRCNVADTVARRSIRVYWSHPLAVVALFAVVFVPRYGPLLLVIGLLLFWAVRLRKNRLVEYSLCRRHHRYWQRLTYVAATSGGISLGFSAWLVLTAGEPYPLSEYAVAAISVLFLSVGLLVGVIGSEILRPGIRRYTGKTIWLSGFGQRYLASLQAYPGRGRVSRAGLRGWNGLCRWGEPPNGSRTRRRA